MDIEKAKRRLESAELEVSRCQRHLDGALNDFSEAEASRNSTRLYYKFSRRHGHGYRQKFRDAKDAAMKELERAETERDEAKAGYEKAKKA